MAEHPIGRDADDPSVDGAGRGERVGPMTTDVFVFAAEHVDVGHTIETRILLNGDPLVVYLPGTRHMSFARTVAREVLTDAFAPLIAVAAKANACHRITCFATAEEPPP